MKTIIRNNRSDIRLFLYSVAVSAVFLLLLSKNSPLYPFNDWVDVHCFFTMGKSILDGLVPYRDLYEQKGPILYFLFAGAAAISRNSFIGVWLLETLFFSLFLYFSGKCARLHLGNDRGEYVVLLVLAPITMLCTAFLYGGGAEELCLWTLSYSFYVFDLSFQEKRLLRNREAFCVGLCAAFCLYVKFTLLGFFLGLAIFVLVWYLVFEKNHKALPATIFSFLGGIVAGSVPVVLYFLASQALEDFFTVYFYNNLFLYQGAIGQYANRFVFFIVCLWASFHNNLGFMVPLVAGVFWLICTWKKNRNTLFAVLLSAAFLCLSTFGGGRMYDYYPMPFVVFSIYGLIAGVLWLRKGLEKKTKAYFANPFRRSAGLCVCAAILLVSAFLLSDNTYMLSYDREELAQFRFAEQIRRKEDATVLNYGSLDFGVYYAADVTPNCRFFCRLNIPLHQMYDTQDQFVEEGQADFVVTRDLPLEETGLDCSHYRLVDQCTSTYEKGESIFYLYEKAAP